MGKQVTIEVNGKTYTIDCDDYINGNYAKANGETNTTFSSSNSNDLILLSDAELDKYNTFKGNEGKLLDEYIKVFVQEAQNNGGFDWRYLAALACVESNFNPNISNSKGFRGMFQFKSTTFCKGENFKGCNWTDWKCQTKCTAYHINENLKSTKYNMDDTMKISYPSIVHNMGEGHWQNIVYPYFTEKLNGGQMTFNKYIEVIKTIPAEYWNNISSKKSGGGWFKIGPFTDISDPSKKRGELYAHALKFPATYKAICAKYDINGNKY